MPVKQNVGYLAHVHGTSDLHGKISLDDKDHKIYVQNVNGSYLVYLEEPNHTPRLIGSYQKHSILNKKAPNFKGCLRLNNQVWEIAIWFNKNRPFGIRANQIDPKQTPIRPKRNKRKPTKKKRMSPIHGHLASTEYVDALGRIRQKKS